MAGKITDRSISPLPNPPSGQLTMKLSNKLTAGSLRSQSPSQAGKPPKKKKKANNGPVVKEESTTLLQVTSHDPVTQHDVSRSHHKTKSKLPLSSYTTSHASFSSSLSSSESDMEEVSMPTVTHSNTMVTMPAEGNDIVESMKGVKSSDHDSSSSSSDSSQSQSDDDDSDDEVILHVYVNNKHEKLICKLV